MWRTRTYSRLPMGNLMVAAALLLAGCATTDISLSTGEANGQPTYTSPSSIGEAATFIDSKIALVERKKVEFGDIARSAKVGTFVGTLGLGAAGIAGLHPDAAIGFAALAGTSYHLGTMSATELSRQYCRDAVAALMCVRGLAAPLRGGYDLLDSVLGKRGGPNPAATLVAGARKLELEPALARSLTHLSGLRQGRTKLELMMLKAEPLHILQSSTAHSLHATAVGILQTLEKSLDSLQPGIGAYQVSATAIVAQVRTHVPAPADTQKGAAAPAPVQGLGSTKGIGETEVQRRAREEAESKADELTALMNTSTDNLNKAFTMLTDATAITEQQAAACQGKLVAATLSLKADPSGPVVLSKEGGEFSVGVSGGTGHYFPNWQGAVPPSDVLRMTQVARPNGSSFAFSQLKDVSSDASYKLLVVDSAATSQPVTIEVKVTTKPKE